MIDTHSHLLPFVDHGCPDLDTCLQMARSSADSGIDTVFCTPHLSALDEAVIGRTSEVMEEVRVALDEAGVDLRLLMGFEVDLLVAMEASPEELAGLAVEGTKGALVLEMPYQGWPPFLEDTVFRLSAQGLRPIIAHPERNERVQDSPEILEGCLRSGAVVQATAASMTGEFGQSAVRCLLHLLTLGYVGLLASDAHAYRTDGWTLGPTLERLAAVLSEEELSILIDGNPRRLLEGGPLQRLQPRRAGRRTLASRVRRVRGADSGSA